MPSFLASRRSGALALLAAAGAVLTGCTTLQTAQRAGAPPPAPGAGRVGAGRGAVGPGGAASGLRPPGAPPVAAAPGGLRPFADVIKDAKRSDGLLTVWQKDDKVWLELKPDDFDQPFFLSPKLKTGIGERGFYGGLMQDERHRRVPPRPQPGAADLAQRRLHRQAGHARGARDRGGLLAEPAGERAGAEPARARAQVGAGRGEHALPRRSARLRHGPAAHLSPGLRLRPAQLGDHAGAPDRRRRSSSTCSATTRRRRSRCRSRARRPARRSRRRRARCPTRAACS